MAFKRFLSALALAAVVCSQPLDSEGDQYGDRQDRRRHATDPILLEVGVPNQKQKETSEVHGASDGTERKKRAFSRWTGPQAQLTGYEAFSVWKPPVYQLNRPYAIPIYGAPGRIPIYFPPQPLNPGTPVDNPLPNRPFRGQGYLPPSTTDSGMGIFNRFNEDDDDDDRPVWGESLPSTRRPPQSVQRPNSIIPTRPPRPANMPDFPPLVHDINNNGANRLSVQETVSNSFIPPPRVASTRRTTTPRPVAQSGPSNCVWAIISCCSAASTSVPDSCFEQRGCPGPFWGASPCDSDFAKAAIEAALKYYE